jgi:hypothetical protein
MRAVTLANAATLAMLAAAVRTKVAMAALLAAPQTNATALSAPGTAARHAAGQRITAALGIWDAERDPI